jgi:PAS domain-containing protein
MKDQSKTKQALIQELAFLKHRIQELEQSVLDLKKAEESLREREEKYRLAFENTSDGIFTIDPDFDILSITPSVERQLGYKPWALTRPLRKSRRIKEPFTTMLSQMPA